MTQPTSRKADLDKAIRFGAIALASGAAMAWGATAQAAAVTQPTGLDIAGVIASGMQADVATVQGNITVAAIQTKDVDAAAATGQAPGDMDYKNLQFLLKGGQKPHDSLDQLAHGAA
jgi:hypothetical protein